MPRVPDSLLKRRHDPSRRPRSLIAANGPKMCIVGARVAVAAWRMGVAAPPSRTRRPEGCGSWSRGTEGGCSASIAGRRRSAAAYDLGTLPAIAVWREGKLTAGVWSTAVAIARATTVAPTGVKCPKS